MNEGMLGLLIPESKKTTYIKCSGNGFLRDFYEDREIIKVIKAVNRCAKLLYAESNAIGIYAMVFEVGYGKMESFKTLMRLTLPARKMGFTEL